MDLHANPPGKCQTRKVSLSASIFSAIFYGACSTSMAFINKAVISSYDFNFPFFIMACQMAISIIVLELCSVLQCIPIPKITVMHGLGDLEFDMAAYSYGAVSVLVQGLYLTLVQKSSENLSALQILHINSYNTLPIFIILSLLFDVSGIFNYKGITGVGFLLCFVLQVFVGVLLNFSLFLCTADNSALTTSLVGVMKSVLQTVVGSFTFGGIVFNELNIVGITLNTFGGILYVFVKYKEKQNFIASPVSFSSTEKLV